MERRNVSTHSHLKVADVIDAFCWFNIVVSTHSHLKVAEFAFAQIRSAMGRFNTQPPEGG